MTRKSAAALSLSIMAVAAMVVVPAALAGKPTGKGGGGTTSSSLTLDLVGDTNVDGVPNWGETVTFRVYTSAYQPHVNLRCSQGGALVYDAWAGFYAGAWFSRDFPLSSTSWTGGAAECTARLVTWSRNGREQTHATLGFRVEA